MTTMATPILAANLWRLCLLFFADHYFLMKITIYLFIYIIYYTLTVNIEIFKESPFNIQTLKYEYSMGKNAEMIMSLYMGLMNDS